MYEAFPRSDYYGSSVTVPDIQKLNFIAFRHSGLGNPRLALWQHSFDRLSDTTFVLYCLLQSRCNLFCFQFSKEELKVLHSATVPSYTAWTIVQSIQTLSSYLSFHLLIQSHIGSYMTYQFIGMLHSLSGFPFR